MKFYTVAKHIVKLISYIFFPVKVIGDIDKFPKENGVILCANHLSYFDAVFLVIAFRRQIRFVAKKVYAEAPVLKTIFKWIGSFGIDPEKPDLAALKRCFSVVKSGEVLGIFPEGTRVIKGKVSNPMPGTIMIAHKTKTPIFYVRIKPEKNLFRVFRKNYLYIGELIETSDLGVTDGKGNQYKLASEQLVDKIYRLGE